jgi:V8-like Glu-specific endopeptidase
MRHTTAHARALCASAVAAAVLAVPVGAQAAPAVRHADRDALGSPAEVARFWTDKRMAAARPAKAVLPGEPEALDEGSTGRSSRAGPIPYDSYELPNTTSFPERVHGKVFFTKPGEGNFVCSGTVVNGANDSTVITAGHCVFGEGGWWTNWAFVPGYRKLNGTGDAPFGVWSATNLLAPQQWTQPASPNYRYDVGAAVVSRNPSGIELEDLVGARGIVFNQPTNQHFIAHGYPAGAPFDGFKLWACESDFGGPDLNLGGTGPPTMAIGCDMTGGSSGGGWVIEDASGNGYVNSVNSYVYGSLAEVMFGPYFDSTTSALFSTAAGQAPGQQQAAPSTAPPPAQPAGPVRKLRCKKPKGKRKKRKKRCRPLRG